MSRVFSFPNPVNETSARIVAAGVVALATLFALTANGWLLVPLVYGFAARLLTGPTLSPLGQLATRLVTPRLKGPHRHVPGPPKQFAQGVGLAFSTAAATSYLAGNTALAQILAVGLALAASLEAAAAICLGCLVYNRIWGCADCDDITPRLGDAEQIANTT